MEIVVLKFLSSFVTGLIFGRWYFVWRRKKNDRK